jgi:hypothetical protein
MITAAVAMTIDLALEGVHSRGTAIGNLTAMTLSMDISIKKRLDNIPNE